MPVEPGDSDVRDLAAMYCAGLLPTAESEEFEARLLRGERVAVEGFEHHRQAANALLRAAALRCPTLLAVPPTARHVPNVTVDTSVSTSDRARAQDSSALSRDLSEPTQEQDDLGGR